VIILWPRKTVRMAAGPAVDLSACEPVLELAGSHGVEMPITEVAAAVMQDGLPVEQAASMLASRSAKPEWYGP
jgi:glycerol-3-phosphate dehydrogenase (NAD(P)+)